MDEVSGIKGGYPENRNTLFVSHQIIFETLLFNGWNLLFIGI